MTPDTLCTLHALALQYCNELKSRDVRTVLESVNYIGLSNFAELRDYLETIQLSHAYPDEKSWNAALKILDVNDSLGISSYPLVSAFYPKYLRAIDDSPNVLHVRGELACLNELPGIAVVGARKITPNGAKIAHRIASYLAEEKWIVVSGLALGVDAAAHQGALALEGDGRTIAVLAHGLDVAKPAANRKLGEEILERGGLWVSEHPVGTPARPAQFVARNRIQLGLSVGSIIIEAEPNSGSITQAKFCLKQKRPLFAVVPEHPENPLGLLSSGTEMLVNELGALPLKTKQDYPKMLDRFSQQRSLMMSM